MSDLWQTLPEHYRFPDPAEPVTVWRGDSVGKVATGIAAKYDGSEHPHEVVLQTAAAGAEALDELINRHTDGSEGSPLVSVTTDLRLAQAFASRPDTTIYEVTVPAERLVRDPRGTGTPGWGEDTELFIPGGIDASEITGVKLNNHDQGASELLRGNVVVNLLHIDRSLPAPTEPNPAGEWQTRK